MLPTAAVPGLVVSVVLWTACGICSAHDVITSATFVTTAPPEVRGQATGLAVSALRVAQGAGVVLAGLAAQVVTPATVIGVALDQLRRTPAPGMSPHARRTAMGYFSVEGVVLSTREIRERRHTAPCGLS